MANPIYHSQYTAAQIEASIGKSPRVNSTTKEWEVWDIVTSAYVSTGIVAESAEYAADAEAAATAAESAKDDAEAAQTAAEAARDRAETAAATLTVDDELSGDSANPVENRVIKGALDGVFRIVSTLAGGITDLKFTDGKGFDTTGGSIPISNGVPVPSDASGISCAWSPCAPGDKFTYTGQGAAPYNNHAWLTSDGTIITWSSAPWRENYTVQAVDNAAYIVINSRTDKNPSAYKGYYAAKQDELTFDAAPTAGSDNPVRSNGIKTAIDDVCISKSATGKPAVITDCLGGVPFKSVDSVLDYDSTGRTHATVTREAKSGNFYQAIQNGDFSDGASSWEAVTNSTISISDGVCSVTVLAGSYPVDSGLVPIYGYSCDVGEKFVVSCFAKSSSAGKALIIRDAVSGDHYFQTATFDLTNDWTRCTAILTMLISASSTGICFFGERDESDWSFDIKDIELISLTGIYGAGNEPDTIEEFFADFPNDYYDFSLGTRISIQPDGTWGPWIGDRYTVYFTVNGATVRVYGGTWNILTGELVSTLAQDGSQLPQPVTYHVPPLNLTSLHGYNSVRVGPVLQGYYGNVSIVGRGDPEQIFQPKLTFDDAPTAGSANPVTSQGIKAAVDDVRAAAQSDAYAALVVKSASGNPVTFSDGADGVPLKALTVDILPAQSGSGDPAPDNIRPISGVSAINVIHADGNLFVDSLANWKNGYDLDNSGAEVQSPLYRYSQFFFPVLTGETYSARYNKSTTEALALNVSFYDADKVFISRSVVIPLTANTGLLTGTFVTPDNCAYIHVGLPVSSSQVQIQLGTALSDYDQSKQTVISFAFGQTIYGGTLDVLTGVLAVNKIGLVLDGTEDWLGILTVGDSRLFRLRVYGYSTRQDQDVPRGCSHYQNAAITTGTATVGYGAYTSSSAPRQVWVAFRPDLSVIGTVEDWKAYLAAQYAAGTPVTCWFEITGGVTTIQLTPAQVTTLLGYNTIHTDNGGAVTASWRCDPTLIYEELTAAILSLGSNI